MRIALDGFAFKPVRAHSTDAGLDLRTPRKLEIYPLCSEIVDTGVHVELPVNTVGMLKSKSGLNMRYNITSEGVIDAGYTGSIKVKLYNHGREPVYFNPGDKITQLVILPVWIPSSISFVNVNDFDKTERGDDGFGSTGR